MLCIYLMYLSKDFTEKKVSRVHVDRANMAFRLCSFGGDLAIIGAPWLTNVSG